MASHIPTQPTRGTPRVTWSSTLVACRAPPGGGRPCSPVPWCPGTTVRGFTVGFSEGATGCRGLGLVLPLHPVPAAAGPARSAGGLPPWYHHPAALRAASRPRCGVAGCPQGVTWLILPVVICLSQRLSHACLSISTLYGETANGSLNQLSFI